MTVADILGVETSSETADTTTHTISLPAGVRIGDWVVTVVGFTNSFTATQPVTWPEGWVVTELLRDNDLFNCGAILVHECHGLEDWYDGATPTVDFTTTLSSVSSHATLRCRTGGVFVQLGSTEESDTTPDPPSTQALWLDNEASVDVVAVAGFVAQHTATFSVSAYPTGYADDQTFVIDDNGTNWLAVGVAADDVTASGNVNPGTFTLSDAVSIHFSFTILLFPAPDFHQFDVNGLLYLSVQLAVTDRMMFGYPIRWLDISDDVREVAWKRGRQHELDVIEASTAMLALNNRAGDFTSTNTAGAYYPYIRPLTPVRVATRLQDAATLPPTFNVALVVGNSGALTTGDTWLQTELDAIADTVTVFDDSAAESAIDPNTYALVVIAESVTPATVSTKWKNFYGGVLVLEHGLWQEHELSSGDGATDALQTQFTVPSALPWLSLAAGSYNWLASGGTVTVASDAIVDVETPAVVTRVVLKTGGVSLCAWTIEAGDLLDNSTVAPGRRAALGAPETLLSATPSTSFEALFGDLVRWLVTPPPVHFQFTGYLERLPMVFPGQKDSVVTATATDAFKLFNLRRQAVTHEDAVLELDPVAFWRMTGAATADSSEAGTHTLTWAGTPGTGRDGRWQNDEAVTLDATDDRATIANEADIELRADMSIEAWIRPSENGWSTIIACNGATGQLYDLGWAGGGVDTIVFGPTDADSSYVSPASGTGVAPPWKWCHVVVTIDWSGGFRIVGVWVNGAEILSTSYGYQPGVATRSVEIGRRPTTNNDLFFGLISELAVYDRVLTANEISTLYHAQWDQRAVEDTDERVRNVLNEVGFVPRALRDGQTELQVSELATTVKADLDVASNTELGQFFINGQGVAVFHDRHYRLIEQSASNATFDDVAGVGYADLNIGLDENELWTVVEITPGTVDNTVTTAATTAVATTSNVDDNGDPIYGYRTLARTTYPNNRDEAGDTAGWLLSRFEEPTVHVERLMFTLGTDVSQVATVLSAELGHRYTVTRTLPGDDYTEDVHLESVEHRVVGKEWTATWVLSPATAQSFWVLGDPELSLLGESTFLGF